MAAQSALMAAAWPAELIAHPDCCEEWVGTSAGVDLSRLGVMGRCQFARDLLSGRMLPGR